MDEEQISTNDGDELIARVAATLREPVFVAGDFDSRVMGEVRRIPDVRRPGATTGDLEGRRWRPWLLRPRTLRISPLAGLAAAAAIAAFAVTLPKLGAPGDALPSSAAVETAADARALPVSSSRAVEASGRRMVQFVLVAPAARAVAVVGSFNEWDTTATRLQRDAGGVWTAQLPLLPGRYTYSFVVDGERWQADPAAPRAVDDDFGAPSSVLTVTGAPR